MLQVTANKKAVSRVGGGVRRRGPAPRASRLRQNRRLRASASASEAADRTGPAGPGRP
jgi:hypothetical protein